MGEEKKDSADKNKKKKIKPINLFVYSFIAVTIVVLVSVPLALVIGTEWETIVRAVKNQTTDPRSIQWETCLCTFTNTGQEDYLVPSRTALEWSAFKSKKPGVLSEDCRCCGANGDVLYDGKVYHTAEIGTQCWMTENLEVGLPLTTYSPPINQTNCVGCGYSYNLYDVADYLGLSWGALSLPFAPEAQVICPAGWHFPTYAEFLTLYNHVGGDAQQLMSTSTYYWSYNDGTVDTGFNSELAGIDEGNPTVNPNPYATCYLNSSLGTYIDHQGYEVSLMCLEEVGDPTYDDILYFKNTYTGTLENPTKYSVRCVRD